MTDSPDNITAYTERLILRHWREDDAEALYKYASDPRVSEMALWPRHTSVEMCRDVIRDFFMPNPAALAIVLKETDEPIGCIGLVPVGDEHFTPLEYEREIGYWIGYPFWNKGLTSEALSAMIGLCKRCPEIKSLLITADFENFGSCRVAEKCGFAHFADYYNNGIRSKAFRLDTERYEAGL